MEKVDYSSSGPSVIIMISGKRKSGKDFVASALKTRINATIPNSKVFITHVALPIKSEWAKRHSLSLEDLQSTSGYKEIHRKAMVAWGEEQCAKDRFVFCKLCSEGLPRGERVVWIIADCRRPHDLEYFRARIVSERTLTIRVTADVATRESRGFVFTKGIDDAGTECGLDEFTGWDYVIRNDASEDFAKELSHIISKVSAIMPVID